MAANGISILATKQARQAAKLDIAAAKRQGKTVATNGTITGSVDATKSYYKGGNVYDLASLPNPYDANENTTNVNETANTGGVIQGRPWVLTSALAEPATLVEALPPSVLVELESWYDGSDGEQFTPNNPADGATFTQWTDKSNFAHNANPIGGATTRPTYQTNRLNALSAVRFDGVNDGLSINPYSSLASAGALTVFLVVMQTVNAGNPRIFSAHGGATELFYDHLAEKFVLKAAGSVGTSNVGNLFGDLSGFRLHTFAFDGSQSTNAARLKYRRSKTNATLSFAGTVGNTLGASDTTMYIGNADGANFFTGEMAEILIFTKALTDVQIANVENYLSTKWDL